VVAKLFNCVLPDVAVFGAKDWQQAAVITRMTTDLDFPLKIVVAKTLREKDGLAMSSRNAYLSVADRPRAVALCESLHRAAELWSAGADTATIERTMRETLSSHGVVIDYAALADPESLDPLPKNATRAIALVAGRLGSTRLIDNMELPTRGTLERGA